MNNINKKYFNIMIYKMCSTNCFYNKFCCYGCNRFSFSPFLYSCMINYEHIVLPNGFYKVFRIYGIVL